VLPNFLVDEVPVIGVVLELEVACILFPVVGLGLVLVSKCPRLSKAGDSDLIDGLPSTRVDLKVEVACILVPVIGLVLLVVAAFPWSSCSCFSPPFKILGFKVFEEDVPVIGLGLDRVIGLVLVLVCIAAVEINCPRLSKAGDFNLVDAVVLFV